MVVFINYRIEECKVKHWKKELEVFLLGHESLQVTISDQAG